MTKRETVLLRVAERNRRANEVRDDQTRQRLFERGMLSLDTLAADSGESVDLSDMGRGVRALTRQIDAPTRSAREKALINRAAARLPRTSGILRPLLWAIYRNGRNRRETMGELGISRATYWRGVKILLNIYLAQ